MPRVSKRRQQVSDSDDDEKVDRKPSTRTGTQNDSDDDDDEPEVMFSSQIPELSQDILPVKDAERSNLLKMTEVARDRACNDMTRLVLFKALAGEPIHRSHCAQEAGISGDQRVSTAVFEEVSIRLKNAFDFELKRIPSWMEKMKAMPKKYKDRYYLINALEDDAAGHHSKAIHNIHEDSTVEKGLLMVILSLAYCKGTPRNDGSRWILDKDLYSLLNRIDENIANEPPAHGSKRRMPTQQSSRFSGGDGVAMTPDVDVLLDKFVTRDYLLKEKATEERLAASQDAEEGSNFYTMGPRAAMEIGRRQIIYFAAEVLDEDPDPTMLAELENDPEEAGTQGTM
jgi:hypothetical protein